MFYVGFAMYGWINATTAFQHPEWKITHHILFLFGAIVLWQLLFLVLKKRNSALPRLDAFVLAFALAGTVLQILYIESNWYYFIAVNSISIYTYWTRGLKKSIVLYLVYLGLSIYGIIQ